MTKNVSLKLGGKKRTLRYNMNAIWCIEDRLGIGIDQLADKMRRVSILRTLLWAGLLHEDRQLDEWTVGEWMEMEQLEEVTNAVLEAMSQLYGDAEGNPKAARARAGTGAS